MRILVIDNTLDLDSWGSEPLRRFAREIQGSTIITRRGPQQDLPRDLSVYDRIVVSGSRASAMGESAWVDRLLELIRRAVDRGTPLLGVCYGHQSLVRALSGVDHCRKSVEPEYGWTKIERLGSSRLLEGLPETFYGFSSHQEEVSRLPKGLRNLARSERCAIQACEVEGRAAWGVQFHPEKTRAEAEASVRKRRTQKQECLPGGARLHDESVGQRIFGNFFAP